MKQFNSWSSLVRKAMPSPLLTVYFDGACPVCRREITHYQRQPGADACAWIDAAFCPADALGPGLDRASAVPRFHVRLAGGRLLRGAPGFAALWRVMPGWRWLGRLGQAWRRPLWPRRWPISRPAGC